MKNFYWIKFSERLTKLDAFDDIMALPDGSEIMMFFFTLALTIAPTAVATHGAIADTTGGTMTPYTIQKMVRKCVYFDDAAVRHALIVLEKNGLISETNGMRYIVGIEDLVGGETDWAEYKRRERKIKEAGQCPTAKLDNVQEKLDIVQTPLSSSSSCSCSGSSSSSSSSSNPKSKQLIKGIKVENGENEFLDVSDESLIDAASVSEAQQFMSQLDDVDDDEMPFP